VITVIQVVLWRRLTGFVALGVLLQSAHEVVEVFLLLLALLERPPLEFGIVSLELVLGSCNGLDDRWCCLGFAYQEELLLGRCHIVDERWSADTHDTAAVES
jgi:hypothetical protein